MSKIAVNKSDIVDLMAEQAEISKMQAGKALNAFMDSITAALRSGKAIAFVGFGTFSVKSRAARIGRNPKTGDPINIQAANVPLFKPGKILKDAVNSGAVVVEEDC